jgi:hypothetical protein
MDQKDTQEEIVSNIFEDYDQTQHEIFEIETRHTRNKLLSLALVIFGFDFIVLLRTDLVQWNTLLLAAIFPAIFVGLAFLARKEPITSMVIAAIMVGGMWIYSAVVTNGYSLLAGWWAKAIVVYLVLAGFQNAREAEKTRKELKV